MKEFDDIETECSFFFYNQFDVNSCNDAFGKVTESRPDAVVIGPTYIDETIHLCSELDSLNIPYVFVDSTIEGTSPLSTFSCDQISCGELAARLVTMSIPEGSSIAVFSADRAGNRLSHNSFERRQGFKEYIRKHAPSHSLKEAHYSISNHDNNMQMMREFLSQNEDIKAIAVLNSRGFIIADLLNQCDRSDIKILSFDLTEKNRTCLTNGQIAVLLCQRPAQQGFYAIKTLLDHLLFKNVIEGTKHTMPIDILFKENLQFYIETI